jgi:glycosyltransferase involved in cell wall biosynthesis
VSYEPGTDVTRRHVLLSTAAVERADVIVHQRLFPAWLLGAAALPRVERSGAAIVYDLDDLLVEMPPDHPRAAAIAPALPEIRRALATADVVTTSTDVLARHLERLGASRVLTIPNAVDPALWREIDPADRPADPAQPVHLACIGSPTHRRDYARIACALLALFERYPDRLRLSIWGDAPRELADHPAVSVDPTYVSSYAEYAEKLLASDIDVGLVPLAPNLFNESKSAIKWLELSAAGIAGVFARTGQYAEWVRDGETGLLAGDDPAEWCRAIETLVVHEERRREIGRRARAHVLETHGIDRTATRWVEAIDLARRRRADRRRRESAAPAGSDASRNPIRIPTAELLSA